MYDELVKALRICEDGEHCDLCPKWDDKQNGGMNVCQTAICKEAADAIEELAAFKAQITDGHFYCMRDGVLYEAKVEPPKGKVFQLPPIEFAEEDF